MCDLDAVSLILTFSIGGITLRVLMALVKDWLKVTGLAAVLVSIVMCLAATAIYLVVQGKFDWLCLVIIGFNVFTGTQVAYRATHS